MKSCICIEVFILFKKNENLIHYNSKYTKCVSGCLFLRQNAASRKDVIKQSPNVHIFLVHPVSSKHKYLW